ncbi:MAG: hypothetical protein ACFCAD_24615 [Pleurocapsa sp.]
MIEKSNTKFIIISTIAVIVNISIQSLTTFNAFASSDADYSFALASEWHDCQQLGSAYQAVYAFETATSYVNICQKDNEYFYLGEAKQKENSNGIANLRSSTFIPAYPLENRSGFKAENGNVSYWIILPFGSKNNLNVVNSNRSEAILTIKRNNRLVSVESSLNKYCHQSETTIAWDTIELQPQNSDQVATIPQQQDIGSKFSLIDQGDRLLPSERFNSDSRFDFYRIGGEIHRLTTCS